MEFLLVSQYIYRNHKLNVYSNVFTPITFNSFSSIILGTPIMTSCARPDLGSITVSLSACLSETRYIVSHYLDRWVSGRISRYRSQIITPRACRTWTHRDNVWVMDWSDQYPSRWSVWPYSHIRLHDEWGSLSLPLWRGDLLCQRHQDFPCSYDDRISHPPMEIPWWRSLRIIDDFHYIRRWTFLRQGWHPTHVWHLLLFVRSRADGDP